jgi:hypothetical protein
MTITPQKGVKYKLKSFDSPTGEHQITVSYKAINVFEKKGWKLFQYIHG